MNLAVTLQAQYATTPTCQTNVFIDQQPTNRWSSEVPS
jgi:hypothetical protein